MKDQPVVVYLGNALSKAGKNPTAVEKVGPRLKEWCRVISASNQPHPAKRFIHFIATIWKARREVDVVIIDTYSYHSFYLAFFSGWMCHLLQIPFCLALHGGDLPKFYAARKKVVHFIFQRATFLIAPSSYLKNYFEAQGFKNIIEIPNALNSDEIPFVLREKAECQLLWVRAFHEIYNPVLAVRVLQNLLKVYPNSHLTMVGPIFDHSFEAVKSEVAKHQLQGSVSLLGKLTPPEWHALSKNCDVFLNTSKKDNMPFSILEAMALGLPIVSTSVGGIPHLIEHSKNGLLASDNSEEEISELIQALTVDPEICKVLSCNGRKTAEQFSWDAIQPQWHKLINSFTHE